MAESPSNLDIQEVQNRQFRPTGDTWISGRILVSELLNPAPIRVIQAAREFRRRGMAGAAFVEILALLRYSKKAELTQAIRLCYDLKPLDWYPSLRQSMGLIQPEGILEAAQWISNYELASYSFRSAYDPAQRVQEVAVMMASLRQGVWNLAGFSTVSKIERHALSCLVHIKKGNISLAFQEAAQGVQIDSRDPWIRRAVNQLYYQVPRRKRAEIFAYGPGGVKSWGISPILGQGLVFKEFTGYVDRHRTDHPTNPKLPLVNVVSFKSPIVFKKLPDEFWRRVDHMVERLERAA